MKRSIDRLRVLLIWPGGTLGALSNFGVPQLLSLASAIRARCDVELSIADLDCERALGPLDLSRLCQGHDLIGISCYSSFDYLKVMALAARIRELSPRAILVTGGYHPSACPDDFTQPGSPFDYVAVGDGEAPLARLIEQLSRGRRPLNRILPSEPVPSPSELLPYDFELLARYLPIARRVATQAEIYLSRGCPYDCSFCMERAKRETSWRAVSPEEAIDTLHQLDRFLDLQGWTLFIADALFGMKRAWRREFLEALARKPLRALRVWLLIRVDLIEREDLELMSRAHVSPGFGLESGDPNQLKRI
ncbi:MAG TPA: cobalamin-dependent protein, partial [Polyangiaceae bacterium]|nr:cobalamin-dependent protein [Polyangiaceae bacterium]